MPLIFIITKHIHVWCVVISYLLFITRILWVNTDSAQLQKTWVKFTPHIVDTLLLITGLTMAGYLELNLFEPSWFSLKISLLISYIALGILAMRRETLRTVSCSLASVAFFTMIYLAINRPEF